MLLSFGAEYLENGDTFSNFCIFVISASSSICTLSFRQIEGVRRPTLVKFSVPCDFDVKCLKNGGTTLSNFYTFMISASISICTPNFGQIELVRPMPLYFFLSPYIQQTVRYSPISICCSIDERYVNSPAVCDWCRPGVPECDRARPVPGSRSVTGAVPSRGPGV